MTRETEEQRDSETEQQSNKAVGRQSIRALQQLRNNETEERWSREKEEQNFVPITKATIEVKSNVVLENKFAKHKLLKKLIFPIPSLFL